MGFMPFFWIAIIILAVVAETMTSALIAIWFMPSAIISMILAFFNIPVTIQFLIFTFLSVLLIIISKTIFKNTLATHHTPTNADSVIGEQAVVTERVSNMEGKGLVKVRGQIWSAKSADGEDLETGDIVSVISIEGVKLVCRK